MGAYDPAKDKVAGHLFQFLGHRLAKLAQLAALGGAFLTDPKYYLIARQIAGQRTAPELALLSRGRRVALTVSLATSISSSWSRVSGRFMN